jgi:hypothetical protein
VTAVALLSFLAVYELTQNQYVCNCPADIFFAASYEFNQSSAGEYTYQLGFFHTWPDSAVVSDLRLAVLTSNCSMVGGVSEFALAYPNGTVFATQNGQTGLWTSGESKVIPLEGEFPGLYSGNLTIYSGAPLGADWLASYRVSPVDLFGLSALQPSRSPGTIIGGNLTCSNLPG